MGNFRKLKKRTVATDIAILGAVLVIFVAGVFFESRRSGREAPQVAPGVGAVTFPTPGEQSEAADTDDPESTAISEPTSTSEPEPTATPTIVVPAGTPDPESVGKTVFLNVDGIENESVVEGADVTLTGTTTPDALLSVNGETVEVDLNGTFVFELELEPGPNFVEIVSSNLRGQETTRVISVVSIQ